MNRLAPCVFALLLCACRSGSDGAPVLGWDPYWSTVDRDLADLARLSNVRVLVYEDDAGKRLASTAQISASLQDSRNIKPVFHRNYGSAAALWLAPGDWTIHTTVAGNAKATTLHVDPGRSYLIAVYGEAH
jgi:hypothetical protein